MIRLLAIDLDGTLLDNKKYISEENLKAIKYAKDKGVKVVIATGRPLVGIKSIIEKINLNQLDDYSICFNGGLIVNNCTQSILSKTLISKDDLDVIYKESRRLNVNIHAFTENQELVAPKMSYGTEVEATINHIEVNIVDFNDFKKEDKFIKAMMIDSKEIIDRVENDINKIFYDRYMIVRSSNIFLEFMGKKTNKGYAILELAKHLGIEQNEIMCIGDNGNDLLMIQNAHIGIAMANSCKEVLEAADYITASNEESGVSKAIYKFI